MDKIEHVGIAVHNLEEAASQYEKLLGTPAYKVETVATQKVRTAFFKSGPNKIELLAATDAQSSLNRFLTQKGEGIHHVAFAVTDIKAEMARLKKAGFEVLGDAPEKGADNKWVAFVHPKSCHGVLVELCQEIDEEGR